MIRYRPPDQTFPSKKYSRRTTVCSLSSAQFGSGLWSDWRSDQDLPNRIPSTATIGLALAHPARASTSQPEMIVIFDEVRSRFSTVASSDRAPRPTPSTAFEARFTGGPSAARPRRAPAPDRHRSTKLAEGMGLPSNLLHHKPLILCETPQPIAELHLASGIIC